MCVREARRQRSSVRTRGPARSRVQDAFVTVSDKALDIYLASLCGYYLVAPG